MDRFQRSRSQITSVFLSSPRLCLYFTESKKYQESVRFVQNGKHKQKKLPVTTVFFGGSLIYEIPKTDVSPGFIRDRSYITLYLLGGRGSEVYDDFLKKYYARGGGGSKSMISWWCNIWTVPNNRLHIMRMGYDDTNPGKLSGFWSPLRGNSSISLRSGELYSFGSVLFVVNVGCIPSIGTEFPKFQQRCY